MASSVNLDISKRVDITCRKGDSFVLQVTFTQDDGTPLIITDHVFKMRVTESDISATSIIDFNNFTYTVTGGNVLTVAATYSFMETVQSGLFVYDLQSKDTVADIVKTWIWGVFKINEDISI